MNQLKNKIVIITIILIFIVIVCMLAITYLKNNSEVQDENNIRTDVEDVDEEFKTEKLRDATQFFSVEKCIQKNINPNFKAKDMNVLSGVHIMNYSVYGQITDNNSKNIKNCYYIVRIDVDNMTFEIEELSEKENSNINKIDLRTELTEIENNGNNNMEYTTIKNEEMCRLYYNEFLKLELEKTDEAYKVIDEQYRNERFSSYDKYKEYVDLCKEQIQTGAISKYSVDYKDDYTEYVIVDNYNNYYTLKETSIMNYTIILDNYTIKTDDYREKYKELEDTNKVQANSYIFLQMINSKDYEHAYQLLDETFKQNNFNTLEKFKQYVNTNFFNYNLNSSISSEKSLEQQGEYYVYKTVIRNNSGSAAESKQLTIVMKLLEDTNFTMSFSI